ncbi:unnamed protein product [Orchesella dallaii]|uniref:Major facilitator superfamily (MFS) profile domain-containing protein n=1 Tax=Orchesella dallaii TaxID=48710 RepID=A0ABP1Q8A4_9HEXA
MDTRDKKTRSRSKDESTTSPQSRSSQADTSRTSQATNLSVPESSETRRSRRASGPGDGRQRKTSGIAIPVQPSQESAMSISRRSYTRGAMFGNIPSYIGSPMTRRPSEVMSTSSIEDDQDREGSVSDASGEDDDLPTRQSSINMSRYSVSIHPVTGDTLFWGFSKKQWFLLLIFSIADLFAGIVYSLQAPFYPQEAEKKGATPTEYGLVFGVFELTMFLVSPIYGKYMSKIGPRVVFNAGIFITGTCCVLFGLLDQIQDRVWFIGLSFLIRILEASGNAGFSTASFTIIACEFPDSVATTFASLETFFGLGLIVGPTMGGGLYQIGGFILPFAVTGALLFLNATMILIFMPKGSSASETTDEKSSDGFTVLSILKVPGVMLAACAIITAALSIGFLSSSLEPHVRQFGLSPVETGLVFVINGGIYAISAPGWGWFCDRTSEPKYITLAGAILVTVGFLFIGPVPFIPIETKLWLTCIGLMIQGLGIGAVFVSSFILALRHSIDAGFPDNVATYSVVSGMWASVLALGLFIGPSIAGYLFEAVGFQWGSVFVCGAGVILSIAVLAFLLFNGKRKPDGSTSDSSETAPLIGEDGEITSRPATETRAVTYGATNA